MAVRTASLPERYSEPALVARGGMGEVYCATDSTLKRPVAIKVLDERLASDPVVRARFAREAHTAARLSGEAGIVTIFDVGEWDGRPFIVMEYVPGGSLQDVLKREGAQAPAVALRWLEQAATALDHAHAKGVVHRDVKPSNLLLDKAGRVHVADFGVASAAGLETLTQTGTVIGTAGYLSPEQAQGRPATTASDCYALALVAWELLAGVRPYENENPMAEAAAHVNAAVPALSEIAPGVPPQVDAVFRQALAKEPTARYSSCARFVSALRLAFQNAAESTRVVYGARTKAPARRRRWPVVLALLVVAASGAVAALAIATHRNTSGSTRAVVRVTVTAQGETVVQTVTADQPAPVAPSTTAPAPSRAATSGTSLASQGYAKMQAGDYRGALPLLEQAATYLQGTHSIDEAYNDYNLAFTLATTQGCSAQVLQLLDASEAIQGQRSAIDHLRGVCAAAG